MLTSVVRDGKSLGDQLRNRQQALDARDAARLQALTFGTIRWSYRLDAIVSRLLKKPLRNKDTDVKVLLWQALYEMLYMRTPDYAVVSSYAALTKKLRKAWAKGLVNATLREFLRTQTDLLASVDRISADRHSLPQWLHDQIEQDWGEYAEQALFAGNQQAPLVLRVNKQLISRDDYAAELQASGAQVRVPALGQHSLIVDDGARVDALPGYEAGHFSVQDSAAQLAAELLSPRSGERVLDACAAPGGKTGHLLELEPSITLLAIDSDEARLQTTRANLARLNLQAQLLCADAADTDRWWDGQPFDAVLLDAPCSALGVLRRHPDIRQLRRQDDIAGLAAQQRRLLDSLWPTVASGGRLIYVTCSIAKRENEAAIADFLHRSADAAEVIIEADWGVRATHGRQILPGQHDSDGFYYAILQKR